MKDLSRYTGQPPLSREQVALLPNGAVVVIKWFGGGAARGPYHITPLPHGRSVCVLERSGAYTFVEDLDSPEIHLAAVWLVTLAGAITAYYAKPGNEAGGSLHIVLDDGNSEDDDVDWCIARARERGDEDGVRLGSIIRAIPRDQRARVLGVPEGE